MEALPHRHPTYPSYSWPRELQIQAAFDTGLVVVAWTPEEKDLEALSLKGWEWDSPPLEPWARGRARRVKGCRCRRLVV